HKGTCMVGGEEIPRTNKFFCNRCYSCATCCATCGRRLSPICHGNQRYCSAHCQIYKAPAVYRYVCPDGRSYVGSTHDHEVRLHAGIERSNPRLTSALTKYPAETWTFELLQLLPPGSVVPVLRAAEQHHIERLRTRDPKHGFNILPAVFARSKNQPHGQHHARSQREAP